MQETNETNNRFCITDSQLTVTGGLPQPPVAAAKAGTAISGPYTGGSLVVEDTDGDGGETIYLNGSDSDDPDGSIVSYVWMHDGGVPIPDVECCPSVRLDDGPHEITLTVTDDDGLTHSDTVIITVEKPNQDPIAVAKAGTAIGGPYTGGSLVVEDTDGDDGETIYLNGSDSDDPDGSIVSYVWTHDGGERIPDTRCCPSVRLDDGPHEITLTVTDDDGLTHSDTVIIEIRQANQPPVAVAKANGKLEQVDIADSDGDFLVDIILDGSDSTDPDGDNTIVSYVWTDNGTEIASSSESIVRLEWPFITYGEHQITLTVEDAHGLTDTDTVRVNVTTPTDVMLCSYMPGDTAPLSATFSPPQPTTNDVIHFTIPTRVFSSLSEAQQVLGIPHLRLDEQNRTIELYFEPVAQQANLPLGRLFQAVSARPLLNSEGQVAGIQGQVGPLPAGDWQFSGDHYGVDMAGFNMSLQVQAGASADLYVDDDAPDGGDGRSWSTAFNDLQDALALAAAGMAVQEIWVARGVYRPDRGTGDRSTSFELVSGVAVRGGFAGLANPFNPDVRNIGNPSVLSGDLTGGDMEVTDLSHMQFEPTRSENCYHVVKSSGVDDTAVLDGFTITGGNAVVASPLSGGGMFNSGGSPKVQNCTFSDNYAREDGGGMFNSGGNPELQNCTFSDNYADDGGGMFNSGGSPKIHACTFSGNRCGGGGGGIKSIYCRSILTNCIFNGNEATIGGGMYNSDDDKSVVAHCTFLGNSANYGGGMANVRSSPRVTDCIFTDNLAFFPCGAMYNWSDCYPNVTRCTFRGNSAEDGGGIFCLEIGNIRLSHCMFKGNKADEHGGGLRLDACGNSNSVTDCVFITNKALGNGGVLYLKDGGRITFTSCTLRLNNAVNGRAVACDGSPSGVNITNSILWDGGSEIWNNNNSSTAISFSNVQDLADLRNRNINASPQFVADKGHLSEGSPCIDAGNNNEINSTEDFDGNPRIVDGDGNGTTIVDMGAYEYGGGSPLQAGDANMDHLFNQSDILMTVTAGKYLTGAPATRGAGNLDGRGLERGAGRFCWRSPTGRRPIQSA